MGSYQLRSTKQAGDYVVRKLSDHNQVIIPFFEKYPLHGVKYRDYKDFCEVAQIMNNKGHLTVEGIRRIKSLKYGMNTGRMDIGGGDSPIKVCNFLSCRVASLADFVSKGGVALLGCHINLTFFYKFSDILGKIIPFFQRYFLQGIKNMDFQDFIEIAKIMENKSHLTFEGLKKIKSLKSGMNTGRDI